MDFTLLIRHRLRELATEQRALAAAAEVTESYISQLLTGKKAPPAPERTDIYERMETFLGLPAGQLAALANLQRKEDLKSRLADPPAPLFGEVRALMVRKCHPGRAPLIRATLEKEPFGVLERLITQTVLNVARGAATQVFREEAVLRRLASTSGRSYEEMRVMVLDFLEADIFNVSADHCVSILDPLIDTWDINLVTFGIKIGLNRRLGQERRKRFDFIERDDGSPVGEERGLRSFRQDRALSGDVTEEEMEVLKKLTFTGRRPTPLFYYRTLQTLRDPLNFHPTATAGPRSGGRRTEGRTETADNED